jgi:hypothetical protein
MHLFNTPFCCVTLYHISLYAPVFVCMCSFSQWASLLVHSFSKSTEFANGLKCFMCFFTKSLLFTGHLSWFDVLLISFTLSVYSLGQLYSRWSTVWFPPSQGHSGDSIILKQCRYALVLPWAVTIAVKFGVNLCVCVCVCVGVRACVSLQSIK